MIDGKSVKGVFLRSHPKLKVLRMAVYDDSHYIIEAVENEKSVDYNAPFYLLDKNTGVSIPFSPIQNLPKFHAAFRDNLISEV